MSSILAFALFVASVAATIFIGLLKDEAAAYLPGWSGRIVELAVSRIPEHLQADCREEWSAHILEYPGKLTQLFQSVRFLWVAQQMRVYNEAYFQKRIRLHIGFALVSLAFLFIVVGLYMLGAPRPVLVFFGYTNGTFAVIAVCDLLRIAFIRINQLLRARRD